MNIKSRIKKIESDGETNFDKWLAAVPDEELESIVRENDNGGKFAEWLQTLTDGEVETLRYGRPGANALKEKFNEYQKQN